MHFLTPLGALVALAALGPIAAGLLGRARVARVRAALRLPAPPRTSVPLRLVGLAAGIAVLGVAAAQPVLAHGAKRQTERTDVQALFVLDTSRSMAASATPTSPTRLDRAAGAAVRLRAAVRAVPSGIATLTDRVLPDLLPVGGARAFDAVVERAVMIERPPPRTVGTRATTFAALTQIASGGYFVPTARRRIVVLLTDGESNPVNADEVAGSLPAARGYRFLAVRFWRSGESVYAGGRPEPGYRPDPTGETTLRELATALGGRAFDEHQLGAASADLAALAGHGPTRGTRVGEGTRTPLAPFVAALALALVLASLAPMRVATSELRLARR